MADFKPYFDHSSFRADVDEARANSAKLMEQRSDEAMRFIVERGLRFVVESSRSLADTRAILQEAIYPEIDVERLFGGEDVPEGLRSFILAYIPRVDVHAIRTNPYDVAYAMRLFGGFDSAEPDLPYQGPPPPAPVTLQPGVATQDFAWALRNIRAELAWGLIPAHGRQHGEGVSIAHLDTGWADHQDVDQANFDLARAHDLIDGTRDAKDPLGYSGNPGHGSKTASVIMSRGGVKQPLPGTTGPGLITGVAPSATYVPIRCIKSVVVIYASDIARGIEHARRTGCDVVSMSLGGFKLKAMQRALDEAVKANLLVVAAAGNHCIVVVYPARYPNCVALAASNVADRPWSGSARGRAVAVCAPGEGVWHAHPVYSSIAVDQGNGTSYATAHAAGTAALWIAFHAKARLIGSLGGGATLQNLFRRELMASARPVPGWPSANYGTGIIDVEGLLKRSPAGPSGVAPDPVAEETHLLARELGDSIPTDDAVASSALVTSLFGRNGQFAETIDFFGTEFVNVLLEHPDQALSVGQVAETDPPGEGAVRFTARLLERRFSETFRENLLRGLT